MYKSHITDLNELKQQLLRTEQAKLDHVVIAAAIHQWRRHSSTGPDQLCVFYISSFAVFSTRCNQLDSNAANLTATLKVR